MCRVLQVCAALCMMIGYQVDHKTLRMHAANPKQCIHVFVLSLFSPKTHVSAGGTLAYLNLLTGLAKVGGQFSLPKNVEELVRSFLSRRN